MNQFIANNGKSIIHALLLVILALVITLVGSCKRSPELSSSQVPEERLADFLKALADPKQDVHGVLLIAPDRHDRLVVLNARLEPTEPCFWDPKMVLTAEKTPVLLPDQCLREDITVLYDKQQVMTITPAIRRTKEGSESLVYLADLDHRVVCTKPSGICP